MNRTAKRIGTILVVAALLAPGARADSPYDWPDPRGTRATATQSAGAATHPDNRGEPRGPGAIAAAQDRAAPRPDDRGEPRGPGALTPVVVASNRDGFDWADAAIGGLSGLGAALLVAGGVLLVVNQRNRARTA